MSSRPATGGFLLATLLALPVPARAAMRAHVFGMTWSRDRHAVVLAVSGGTPVQIRRKGAQLLVRLPDAVPVGAVRSALRIGRDGVASADLVRDRRGGLDLVIRLIATHPPRYRLVQTRFLLSMAFGPGEGGALAASSPARKPTRSSRHADRPTVRHAAFVPLVSPTPAPESIPPGEADLETFPPLPAPSEPPAVPAPLQPPLPVAPPPSHGFVSPSSLTLDLEQIQDLDDYAGGGPGFAYPTAPDGLEWKHWFDDHVGVALCARVFDLNLYEEANHNHTDMTAIPELALRFPVGLFEPRLAAGYYWRQINVVSAQAGSTLPFAPFQLYRGAALGLGLRTNFSPGFALDLGATGMPWLAGGPAAGFTPVAPLWGYRAEASLLLTYDQVVLSLGYRLERIVGAAPFMTTLSGITLGVGWVY